MTLFAAALCISEVAWGAPGDHIGAGGVTLTPSIALGFQYQSNVYRSDDEPTGATSGTVRPAFNLTAVGNDHSFGADGSWTLRKYLVVDEALGTTASGGERSAALDRYDMFGLGAKADLFRRSSVGLRVTDDLTRSYWTVDQAGAESPYVVQMRNDAGGAIPIRPGQALEIVPTVHWQRNQYLFPEISAETTAFGNVQNTISPGVTSAWAFLPQTSLNAGVTANFSSWQSPRVGAAGPALPSSTGVRAQVGVAGRVTPRISALVNLGYAPTFFDEDSITGAAGNADADLVKLQALTTQLQLRYLTTLPAQGATNGVGESALALGYLKDYRLPYFTNYAASHTAYLDFGGRFERFAPHLRYSLRADAYNGDVVRNDLTSTALAGVGFYAKEYAVVTAQFDYLSRRSTNDEVEFDNAIGSLNITFTY